ncbi:tRNA pseudouridine synthase B [Crocosphaera chwakensis CCY0110]|uniref:tRNA pseudouridine synthase B n=1 Tax=Crocosphaera chwakensis CCY0110 TaxID=391612 RepID=A3IIH4_9CHRO|nr:tRNA pseudouridine synthase B [Crocosphaera chwakensis CCY0110]
MTSLPAGINTLRLLSRMVAAVSRVIAKVSSGLTKILSPF